jgi:hypothetical protein
MTSGISGEALRKRPPRSLTCIKLDRDACLTVINVGGFRIGFDNGTAGTA